MVDGHPAAHPPRTFDRKHPDDTGGFRLVRHSLAYGWPVHPDIGHWRNVGRVGNVTGKARAAPSNRGCQYWTADDREASYPALSAICSLSQLAGPAFCGSCPTRGSKLCMTAWPTQW